MHLEEEILQKVKQNLSFEKRIICITSNHYSIVRIPCQDVQSIYRATGSYKRVHFLLFCCLGCGRGLKTALDSRSVNPYIVIRIQRATCEAPLPYLIASSKTLFKFRCVNAEHSRYLCALMSFATINAWSYDTGSILFWRRLSRVAGSSLKSSLVPTRMIGTPGA